MCVHKKIWIRMRASPTWKYITQLKTSKNRQRRPHNVFSSIHPMWYPCCQHLRWITMTTRMSTWASIRAGAAHCKRPSDSKTLAWIKQPSFSELTIRMRLRSNGAFNYLRKRCRNRNTTFCNKIFGRPQLSKESTPICSNRESFSLNTKSSSKSWEGRNLRNFSTSTTYFCCIDGT